MSAALRTTFESAVSGEHGTERELILMCARTHVDAEAGERIRQLLKAEPDWEYAHRTALSQGVSALLYLSLRNTSPELVPDGIMQQMRATFHASGLAVHVLVQEYAKLQESFENHGIPSLLVKGPALAVDAYGDLARRKPGDLDLLIAKEDFAEVSQILKDRGYSVNGGYQTGMDFSEISDHIKTKKGVTFYNRGWTVDLHWTLDDYPIATNLDMDRIWKRRKKVGLQGFSAMSLSPEDHLQFLACHGSKHNWGRVSMICDMAELIRRHPSLDWDYVLSQAKESRRERMLSLGLFLASALLSADVPVEIARRTERDRRVRFLARRVGDALFEEPSTSQVHLLRLMVLEKAGEKLGYLAHRWVRTH